MKQTKKISRKVISYVLALVMVLSTMTGIVPGMSLKAQAAPTETLLTTITPTGKDTYNESTKGVVNVTLSNIGYYASGYWRKSGTVTVTPKEGYTITKCRFIGRGGVVSFDDTETPFSKEILSGSDYVTSIEVYGYANKAAQTITVSDVTATYGDNDKSVSASVTTPATGGGAISYTVKDGSVDYIDVASDGKLTIKKVPASGKAYVIVKAAATDDYAETTKEVTVTIAKANPETPTGMTGKYGQTLSTVSLPGGWSWADDDTIMNTGVGDYIYKANYNPTDATNYNSLSNVDLTVKVGKGDGTISFGETVVESTIGAEPPSVYFESTGDGVVTFTSDNENVATVNDNGYLTITGVGETTITASVVDSDTYQYATKSVSYKLIVNKRSASIKTVPTASEITYGQTLADSTLSGGEVFGNIEGTFSWADSGVAPAVSDSETTEYAVKFTPKNSDNYAESTCKVKIKVNKKTVSATELEDAQKPVAKTGDDVVYTGEPIELVKAPTTDLPLDYEAYYSTDDGDSWSKDIPKKTDPGTYTVKVKYVSKGGNCNDIILDDITATITPADKKALTDAITAAKAYYDTIKGNTDYSEAADKLDKAIKAAEEVAKEDKVTKAAVSTAAEALNTAKATAEAAVKDIDDTKAAQAVIDKINELKPVENIKPEDRTKIEAAREVYKKLSDDQKTKLTGLDSTAVSTLEAAEKALDTAEKAAFDAEKEAQKKATDARAAEGDSDASKKLIEDAKKAIDALAYDETKSLDENKKAVEAILTKLKEDLTTQRAADKKEADDTAAAKKVTDAIKALPAIDKIATTDKAAIEAARKAYDALTADQKKKVPADVLKKLTDAEAAEKAAKELEAAKKEAQAAMNEQVTVTQKGNKFTVKWKKAKSADGYYVYAQYCGKKITKPVKTVKKNTTTKVTIKKINGKKLNLKKQFRVYVVPYKIIDGKKVKLAKSMVDHVVGSKSTKYSNVKKLTLKKTKYTVKVGKTAKIKAKITLVNKNKKHIPKSHGKKLRYKSSDTSIAIVDKNGKIKGIKKGKCTIYVYSINGLTKKAQITVK